MIGSLEHIYNQNEILREIKTMSESSNIPCGVHVVSPIIDDLKDKVADGYRFIPFSIDSVFLNHVSVKPNIVNS